MMSMAAMIAAMNWMLSGNAPGVWIVSAGIAIFLFIIAGKQAEKLTERV